MNYGEKFILKINNKNLEFSEFEVLKFLMIRPDNKNIIAESVGFFHYFKEIKINEFNQIISIEDMLKECNNLIYENKKQIENIVNLPNYHFMRRIIKLNEEIETNLINKSIYEQKYKKTQNKCYLYKIQLIEKSIKQKQKGIRRLTKRVYKQMKEHPEIDYKNLKEYHYNKNYFEYKISYYENTIKNIEKSLKYD